MKFRLMHIVAAMVSAMVLTAAANAQTAQRYRAEVGFGFSVGGQEFAAGEYVIERTNATNGIGGLKIMSVTTGNSRMINAIIDAADDRESSNRLIFFRYGDRYYLKSIETPTLTAKFGKSRAEMIEAKRQEPTTVAVGVGPRAAK